MPCAIHSSIHAQREYIKCTPTEGDASTLCVRLWLADDAGYRGGGCTLSVRFLELFHHATIFLFSTGTDRRCGPSLMNLMEDACTDPTTKETCYARMPGIRKRFSSLHASQWLDVLLARPSIESALLRVGKRTLASTCCTVRERDSEHNCECNQSLQNCCSLEQRLQYCCDHIREVKWPNN